MELASMSMYTGILVSLNPLLFHVPTISSVACKLHTPILPQLRCYSQFNVGNSVSSESYNKEDNAEEEYRGGYGGLKFKGTVPDGTPKLRLDAWVAGQLQEVSRARIQSSVRQGLVQVNGHPVNKASHVIRGGDIVSCTVSTLSPLRADPEDIPLDIVYEDNNVLVVNKPAHIVVHPAPGNLHGTLVSGILHHCGLQSVECPCEPVVSETEDDSDNDIEIYPLEHAVSPSTISCINVESIVRPGIVHRLDKGTSGLLVVAKDEHAHAHLSDQFRRHTVFRRYISLTCGVPSGSNGRIEIPIARDLNNRIRMAAVPNPSVRRRARIAASRYRVIEAIAGGGIALVEWQLETGRTHQIRVHSQYLGYPILGDEVYGGTAGMALSRVRPKVPSKYHGVLSKLISNLQRPCLHALALGFEHPQTGKEMKFSCAPPPDFMDVLLQLRNFEAK